MRTHKSWLPFASSQLSKSSREHKKKTGGYTKQFPLYMCTTTTTTTTLILFEFYFRCVSEEQARKETNPIIVWRSRQPNGPVLYICIKAIQRRELGWWEKMLIVVCVCVCCWPYSGGSSSGCQHTQHTQRAEPNPISNQEDSSTLKKMERLCRPSRRRAPRTHGRRRGERFAQCANQLVEFEMHITFQWSPGARGSLWRAHTHTNTHTYTDDAFCAL
jgi:hypothetical protein